MKTVTTLLCLLLLPAGLLRAQEADAEMLRTRRDKIASILRVTDLRTRHDGTLYALLSDRDAAVRERATLAFGSIQDTAALTPLVANLSDGSREVAVAAAWAIGQTAPALTAKGREALEHDLIWTRLDATPAKDRLIEEIGKFGTARGLDDLVARFGATQEHRAALIMAAARFGIRGIATTEGVRYLLHAVRGADADAWQTVYALQRIGDHAETRAQADWIVGLLQHRDGLVRMNAALLLGKLRAAPALTALLATAEHDRDWRVRVNALKALGNYDLTADPALPALLRRSFLAENVHVAVTAIATFGVMKGGDSVEGVAPATALLRELAVNDGAGHPWQLQAEAALALARRDGAKAFASIRVPASASPALASRLIAAAGSTGNPEAAALLLGYASGDDAILRRAAIEGLQELSHRRSDDAAVVSATFRAAMAALSGGDVALVTTAAGVLGDSLFARREAVPALVEALSRLRLPDDVEAMQEIIASLGKINDERAVPALREALTVRDASVAQKAAEALRAITGRSYDDAVGREYEPAYVDLDFAYLRALPETVKVKVSTIRGDFTMELYREVAPFTVMSFVKLAKQRGFYRGLSFHRVVPNFVVQGGDPRGDGWGGAGYAIRSEFSPLRYETGTVGIASAGKDTEGSQFFITQSPQPHLEGRYTIMGKVTQGMDVVDRILVDDHMFEVEVLP